METKETEKTQVPTASSETPKGENVTSTPTYEIEVETSADSAQNVKPQEDTIEKPTADIPVKPEEKTEEKQRNIPAELGKMSALERERNERSKELELERKSKAELEKKLKEVEERAKGFDALERDFRERPELYENFRRNYAELKGVQLPEYNQVYGSLTQPTYQQPTQIDPELIREQVTQQVKADMRMETELSSGFSSFISKHPEMDPVSLSDEQRAEAGARFERMKKLIPALREVYPEATMETIFENAYSVLPEVRASENERSREISELTGMAKAYSKGAAGSDGISGGSTSSVGTTVKVKMTTAEKSHYDRLVQSNPKIAQRYLENVANKS